MSDYDLGRVESSRWYKCRFGFGASGEVSSPNLRLSTAWLKVKSWCGGPRTAHRVSQNAPPTCDSVHGAWCLIRDVMSRVNGCGEVQSMLVSPPSLRPGGWPWMAVSSLDGLWSSSLGGGLWWDEADLDWIRPVSDGIVRFGTRRKPLTLVYVPEVGGAASRL